MMNVRQQGENPSPWESISNFSRYIFCWTVPYFRKGYKKDLVEDDLYDCPSDDTSVHLGDKLEREWEEELRRQKTRRNYRASLRLAVMRAFGKAYLIQSFFCLLEECITRVLQPLCLGWFIRYFSNPGSLADWQGYLSAAGVCFLAFVYVCSHHPLFFGLLRSGMRIRVAACTLIYRKSLKLSQRSMGKTTVGQMVNLLSNDVNRFDQAVVYLPFFVVGPIQTIIVLVILWEHLGVSCLFGLVVLLLFIPFQTYMGKLFSKLRSKTAILTDERIRLMNEIVAGMRVIKMYTWEYPFARLVALARKKEINRIRYTSILRGFNIAVYFAASKVIVFVCFVAYILMGNNLTAEIVFVSMSLYNNLRLSMTFFFPMAISQWAESSISMKRIQTFMELGEQEESSTVDQINLKIEPDKCGIWLNNVSAKWNEESEEMTLRDLNMNVQPGELWAVVGPVGSGKSSLLMSVLGELPASKGEIKVRGKMAYSSQEPWVFAGTIQQNVIFGLPMDKLKYQRVLHVCALDKDIKLFPYGDQTLVGERGVSLSGGQKARVNLARSIYMDGDVYLMDDPLSAVDVSVAKHLFDKCINGYIKKKARILVTHQVQFLKSAHRIIILKHGKVLAIGGYHDLVNLGYDLLAIVDEENVRKTSESQNVPKDELMTSLPTPDPTTSMYSSQTSLASMGLAPDENNDKLTKDAPKQAEEQKSEGSVRAATYFNYIKAGGGCLIILFIVVSNLLTQLIYSYSDYWLSLWTNYEERKNKQRNATEPNLPVSNSTDWELSNSTTLMSPRSAITWEDVTGDFTNVYTNIYIYSGLMVALFVLSLTRTVASFFICMASSVNMHNTMFRSVTRAPIAFFEKNPVGRILNRFTKDLGLIDELLPFTVVNLMTHVLTSVGVVVVVVYVSPYVAIPTVVLLFFFMYIRRFYINTARDVKRLEGTTRSPVFSHLSTSLYGITTIRSFGVQRKFEKDFYAFQDMHTSSWFTLLCIDRWFGITLDLLTVLYITFLAVFLIVVNTGMTGGNVGLAVSSALVLTETFRWGVRQSTELESQMTSVERVLEYSKLKPEAELEASPDKKPPSDWPKDGSIQMRDFSLTYPDSGDVPVLKKLNCHIKGGEKVGIVGRTGAGKSSIISALFRMAEPQGTLTIDGVNSQKIGLHDLRSKISIIPQDPILFTGPVRRNIDPFNEKKDEELWNVLEEVQLKEVVMELPGGLDSQMSEGGSNFSVGQRQLICLARALLRRNQILVLDEATANVDHKTDALIQNTIRDKFGHCTVLTIAHRLNTIMDSDKILVLDAGRIMEFDEPLILLRRESSQLTDMVKQAGPVMAKQLHEIAREAKRNGEVGQQGLQRGNSGMVGSSNIDSNN